MLVHLKCLILWVVAYLKGIILTEYHHNLISGKPSSQTGQSWCQIKEVSIHGKISILASFRVRLVIRGPCLTSMYCRPTRRLWDHNHQVMRLREGLAQEGWRGGWLSPVCCVPREQKRHGWTDSSLEPLVPLIGLWALHLSCALETIYRPLWAPGREDPLEKEMATTPVFLPGKSHGQRSLAGYSPWGHRVGHDWATSTFTVILS